MNFIPNIAVIVTSVLAALMGAAFGEDKEPPGAVTFLGVGYNILKGNPEGASIAGGGIDPGLHATRKILKLTYDEKKVNYGFKEPDEVYFIPRESCATVSKQDVFFGTQSYQEKISADVEVSGGYEGVIAGFEFSLSARYENVKNSVESSHEVFFEEIAVCSKGQARYLTERARNDKFALDSGFASVVCQLPTAYNQDTFMRFLDTWGTHVIKEVNVGTRKSTRSSSSESEFVKYAMTNVESSVSASGSYKAGTAAVKVDMAKFEESLSSGMSFGSNEQTFSSGSDEMNEPIGITLMAMNEIFHEDYWQLFSEYVAGGSCNSGWISDLNTIQANVLQAMKGYATWKNAQSSSDPIVEIPITWPEGKYGLLMPTGTGCPKGTGFTWNTGFRYHDCEDYSPNNGWSDPCHMQGPLNTNIQQNFCMKTLEVADIYHWTWPEGEYCIFSMGGSCPAGMNRGIVVWDDEDDSGNTNSIGGTIPDGVYNINTHIFFCCPEKGHASNPIYLPADKPFILFKETHECQKVHGMTYTDEYIRWDTQDSRGPAFPNADEFIKPHPYPGSVGDSLIKFEFCYYEPQVIKNYS